MPAGSECELGVRAARPTMAANTMYPWLWLCGDRSIVIVANGRSPVCRRRAGVDARTSSQSAFRATKATDALLLYERCVVSQSIAGSRIKPLYARPTQLARKRRSRGNIGSRVEVGGREMVPSPGLGRRQRRQTGRWTQAGTAK
jgi:hypothetical protein